GTMARARIGAPYALQDFLSRIAVETARMSYPGSMSRGQRPVVSKGAKAKLERSVAEQFPILEVWNRAGEIDHGYDAWHEQQSRAIAEWIKQSIPPDRASVVISTKFLNTFMHQLMKYEPCRVLWHQLHLPLDKIVFDALFRLRPKSLSEVHSYFSRSPY